MPICSGRKKPGAYDEFIFGNEMESICNEWLSTGGIKWVTKSYESWKKFNDLSSKTVIDNTFLPVFHPYWFDSDDQKES